MNLQLIARSLIREAIREVDGLSELLTLDQLNGIADGTIASLSDAGLLVEPKTPGRVGRPPKAATAEKTAK